jgi:hypothetical protein
VLRGIFEPKRSEINEQLNSDLLHNEKIRDLYKSPIIVAIIQPRRLGWLEGWKELRRD